MKTKSTRREFLRIGSLTSLGLLSIPHQTVSSLIEPVIKQTKRKKVVVVGGGLAGLSSAYHLVNAGHDVTILEAQMIPGGRVRTIRSSHADNFYVEAGAGRFPLSHELTMHFIKEFGLEITPFYPKTGKSTTYVGGLHQYNDYNSGRNLSKIGLPLSVEEIQLGERGLFNKYLKPSLGKVGNLSADVEMDESGKLLDQQSWTAFLRSQGMSNAVIDYFNIGAINSKDGEEISAYWLLRDILSGGEKYKIKGGNDQLPRSFAKKLESHIKYGCPVNRIEQSADDVNVYYKNAAGDQVIKADCLVLAVPFSVAGKIDMSNALSKKYLQLINELQYGSASRVTLQFKNRNWEHKGLSGFAASDDPQQVWHPTFDQKSQRGILQSYIRMSLSKKISQMNEGENIQFVLNKIEQIFPGVIHDFEGGMIKCWDNDPWAGGAAAVHAPGQVSKFADAFEAPVGNIYFAGEHLSPWPAWMQGAIFSGLKAAKAINAV